MAENRNETPMAVSIGLGDGVDFAIGRDDKLYVIHRTKGGLIANTACLGKATTKRFIDLQNILGQLIIHAVNA